MIRRVQPGSKVIRWAGLWYSWRRPRSCWSLPLAHPARRRLRQARIIGPPRQQAERPDRGLPRWPGRPADPCYLAAGVRQGDSRMRGQWDRGGRQRVDAVGPDPDGTEQAASLPSPSARQRCPASPGKPVNTAGFGGVALGTGPVRLLVGGTGGNLRRGIADLINPTSSPPWLGLKPCDSACPAIRARSSSALTGSAVPAQSPSARGPRSRHWWCLRARR